MGTLHQARTAGQSTADRSLDSQLCNLLQRHLCAFSGGHERGGEAYRLQTGEQLGTRSASQLVCVYH